MSEGIYKVAYLGTAPRLRGLAVKTTLLTLFTLGIYRFWARARIRQYFWSSIAPGDHPLEYTGKGLEKFLGFLIAVAILAVYLGILQLILSFWGMSMFDDASPLWSTIASYISFFAVLPLIYYAQYRARRYLLSRTRWRGIRFGAEPAAWGYVKVALWNSFLTIITLGILLPRQTFNLEKYRTDRSYFGSASFEQNGRWQALYPAMKHLFIGALIFALGVFPVIIFEWQLGHSFGEPEPERTVNLASFVLPPIGAIWLYFGYVYYSIYSFRYLTSQKKLDGRVTFASLPRVGVVVKIYLIAGLVLFVMLVILGILMTMMMVPAIQAMMATGAEAAGAQTFAFAFTAIFYLMFFVVASVIALTMITQPLIKHYASETVIHNVDALDEIQQREGDDFAEAEGFADALDIGAAI